jgi:DNA primase
LALFPQTFIDDLKIHADIVVVIQDYVSLKKAGAKYKGLCPFHGEKTPSFNVDRDKGFFHCFGCQVGGDVIKFIELHERIGFADAVKQLAQRFGMQLPELDQTDEQRAGSAERESLLKIHEAAATWFREQLASPAGARIRKLIADRGLTPDTSTTLGLGFAPPSRDALTQALLKQGFSQGLLVRAGLVVQRDEGGVIDRFRNRLMVPICRDTGSVIAFGGRALDADQQPKYLNSPETPIYSKSRTLYGLNLSKSAIRQGGFAVLVEGYFDFAQVYQAGYQSVVASCGTALTPQQAQQLRRFTGKVVLSFDPDAAGQGAAAKSCEMLVEEDFEVNVAILPTGEDPDTFVRRHGPQGYAERLKQSQPYLEYLLNRAAARHNLNSDEGKVRFISEMVPVAGRIPSDVLRERFADRLAQRTGIAQEVIRGEIRKARGDKRVGVTIRDIPSIGQVTKAEKALIWFLIHDPARALSAIRALDDGDFATISTGSVLDLARKLDEDSSFSPSALLERLNSAELKLVTGVASEPQALVKDDADECVRILKRTRLEREYARLQVELASLQAAHAGSYGDEFNRLLERKQLLLHEIAKLKFE